MAQDSTQQHAAIIDGKAVAAKLRESVAAQVQTLVDTHGIKPGLAVVLVGDNPASETYVRSKRKLTVEAGMESYEHNLPDTTSQEELLELIDSLNNDPKVNGILVQLPLPSHVSSSAILTAIDPNKDVDGFHVVNTGRLWSGEDTLVPCTPKGCVILLKQTLDALEGSHAVIVGRSNIVGKPVANLLLRENCTVTVAHSRTRDLPAVCREADIVIAAVGVTEMVRGDWIKPGAAVIDVGINRVTDEETGKNRLKGDVAFDEAAEHAGAITPVPGGVGPMTIACLLENTVTATCLQHGIDGDSLA